MHLYMYEETNTMLRNNSMCKKDYREDKMNYSGCSKLPSSENKVRKISQPERIPQHLRSTKKLLNSSKNSVVKISQPERIPSYIIKNASSQKKNDTVNQLRSNQKKVQRSLIFTPATAKKASKNLYDDSITNERDFGGRNKRSLLLPPNSIKDMHIRTNQCNQNKSTLSSYSNKARVITTDSTYKYSRKFEKHEHSLSVVENKNTPVDSVVQEKSNKTSVIQHTSLHLCNMIDQPNVINLNSMKSDEETLRYSCNGDHLDSELNVSYTLPGAEKIQIEKCSINTDSSHKKELLSTNDCEENVCIPANTVKMINKFDITLRHDVKEDNEYVKFSKRDLINVASKLKHHICRLQEDISCLQLTLTFIENMLSPNTNELNNANEISSKRQMIENLNNDEQVVCNTKKKTSHINITIDSPKEIPKEPNSNSSKYSETCVPDVRNDNLATPLRQTNFVEGEKENTEDMITPIRPMRSRPKSGKRRRSARLMEKALKNSSACNDSFENLERIMNIENIKFAGTVMSPKNRTQMMNKCKSEMAEKPWKEFVALKSRMSFLLTPNINRCKSSESLEENVHPKSCSARASLSNKLIAELHNLYADTPNN